MKKTLVLTMLALSLTLGSTGAYAGGGGSPLYHHAVSPGRALTAGFSAWDIIIMFAMLNNVK